MNIFNNLTNQQIDVTFDDGKLCVEESFSIAGILMREDGSVLANTTVNLTGEQTSSQKTDDNGAYNFTGLIQGDYTVSPSKSQYFHDGVNIIDVGLIRIYNRSLDSDKNLSVYQQLAANTRKVLDGGLLTVADETELKRMNTLDIDEFPDYTNSWVFVPQSYSFSDPDRAFEDNHPTSLSFENIAESMTDQNFIAVKLGDINADLNLASPRSNKEVVIGFEDANAASGDSLTVNLLAMGFENIQNMQFTISWDPEIMVFMDWVSTMEALGLEESSFSTRFIEEGKLTFAHSVAPEALNIMDSTLFALKFGLIGEDGQTSALSITGDPLEILVTDNALTPVNVTTTDATVTVGEATTSTRDLDVLSDLVENNRPNPFSQETIIPFQIRNSGEATLNVYSHTGQLIYRMQGSYSPGKHNFLVTGDILGSPGVYYYQVVTEQGHATKSMIYTQ